MSTIQIQRGFTLVSAVFLLVIILALGAAALTVSTVQHRTSTQDLLGAHAYQAARAGIEWGAFHVLQNPGGIACAMAGGAANVVAMPVEATVLSAFTVSVNCEQFAPVAEGNGTVTMFRLTSTANTTGRAVGDADYVERGITVSIAQ
jgi:MSHA biogenesis protein MshP